MSYVPRSPPESGKYCVPRPREDYASRIIVRLPPAPGTLGDPGSHGNDTRRTISRAKSTTPPFKAPTTSRSDAQDVRIVLRCGYGHPGRRDRYGRSARGLHARLARISRCALSKDAGIDEGRLNLVNSGVSHNQRNMGGSPFAPACRQRPTRPVEDGCPQQGLTEATPSAQLCAPYPDETRRITPQRGRGDTIKNIEISIYRNMKAK